MSALRWLRYFPRRVWFAVRFVFGATWHGRASTRTPIDTDPRTHLDHALWEAQICRANGALVSPRILKRLLDGEVTL